MTWFYSQRSGELKREAEVIACGYSGKGACKNSPDKQHLHNYGPIPRGRYTVLQPRNSADVGPYALQLRPHPENRMHGRGAFMLHGDSKANPGTASEGCIILPRKIREQIWGSGDHELEVTE